MGWRIPAVFVGEHPETGEFLVAKKGIFAKKQEYYTTHAEIDEKLSGDLAKKFHICLDNFKDLGIKGILQGDLMFTKGDLEKKKLMVNPILPLRAIQSPMQYLLHLNLHLL